MAAWHQVFELNFFAPLKLARGFAGALHRGKGAIVNVTSIAGHSIHPFAGSAYSTSKAALSALTREMANEFAELGVRVNAIAPGWFETEMNDAMFSDGGGQAYMESGAAMGRPGIEGELDGAMLYLASDASSFVTGHVLQVSGGWTAT